MSRPAPSIRARMGRMLLLWSLIWTCAVSAAVWTTVQQKLDDKLDNRLRAAAEVMVNVMRRVPLSAWQAGTTRPSADRLDEGVEIPFTWQLVDAQGRVIQRADNAPTLAFHHPHVTDLSSTGDWRVFGRTFEPGYYLYVAHEGTERTETQVDVALHAALAALAMAMVGHLWLRMRFWRELQPLQALSLRLQQHDPGQGKLALGAAERIELEPLHRAVDNLSSRLAERIRREQAFSAHAAHALRTPLAGVDAQLSIALREAPSPLQPRLQRIRSAAQRMQHVVTALLGLFRAEGDPRREAIELHTLVASLPAAPLSVQIQQQASLHADPDLLAATLINLFDNAHRHGARQLQVSVPRPQVLRVEDDGQGLPPARRQALECAMAEHNYEALPGLGLVLADVVARAHGGSVVLPTTAQGFAVELLLGESSAALATPA